MLCFKDDAKLVDVVIGKADRTRVNIHTTQDYLLEEPVFNEFELHDQSDGIDRYLHYIRICRLGAKEEMMPR